MSSFRLIVGGRTGSPYYGYITEFNPDIIDSHPDFTTGSLVMNPLSAGTEEVYPQSGVTIGSITSKTITLVSKTSSAITYQLVAGSSWSYYLQVSTESYLTLTENSVFEFTPSITCSFDSFTTITYSIQDYNSVPAPSWAAINFGTAKITLTTPTVTSATDWSFYVVSSVTGLSTPVLKIINVRVNKWSAPNWSKWNPGDYQLWANQNPWGDGIIQTALGEQWDDANSVSGDGCSDKCKIESGYLCQPAPDKNNVSYWTKACGNGNINSGEGWDDGNNSIGDGWNTLCKIENGFKCDNFSNKPSFCYPHWGDGKRDSVLYGEEWDDGNNMNLDGCDGNWKVEANFVWSSLTGIDIWITKYSPPVVSKSSFDSSTLQITLEFDQIMMIQNISDFDISVDIFGPNSPYSISWNTSFDSKTFKVRFFSSPSLLGGVNEVLRLQIINVLKFKSEHQITILAPKLFTFTVPELPASESAKSGGSSASYMFILLMLMSIGVSILTGGSIELMWSLANTLQIMFYYGMLDLYYPPELLAMFSYTKYSNFDNPAFDFLKDNAFTAYYFFTNSLPTNFNNLGYSSSSVLVNFFCKIIVILIFGLTVIVLGILWWWLRKKSNGLVNFI